MRNARKVLARRGFLAGALAAPFLAGCSGPTRIAIGGRETYTPPPPGIDEIYRTELLEAVTDLATNLAHAETHGDFPAFLTGPLETHQRALRTGAEQEKVASAEAESSAHSTSPSESAVRGAKDPVTQAMTKTSHDLAALRDLYAHAAIQVSGDFADLCASGAAWAEQSAIRLGHRAHAAGVNGVKAPEKFSDLKPAREVPEIDPPEPATADLIATPLKDAQIDENFAAYALEVAATRVEKSHRDAYVKAANTHAARAEAFAEVAEHLGLDPVAREAGYALPRPLGAKDAAKMRVDVEAQSLANAVELAGLAPFTERAAFVRAALESARALEPLQERIAPYPGIDAGEN